MLGLLRRVAMTATLIGLLTTNVLSLTSSAFNAAISGMLASTLGVKTVSSALQGKLAARDSALRQQKNRIARQKVATRRFGSRLASRTRRVAAKSIASIPAESIPLFGVAVLVADTGYELYAACETLRDLDVLYAELDVGEDIPEDAMHSVCEPELPDPSAISRSVLQQADIWWQAVKEAR